MRRTLRALAALLGYPSEDLKTHIPEIRMALDQEGVLPRARLRRLSPLLDDLEHRDVLASQIAYTDLFDRSRALALHLFEHVHGDSRERGQAMIDLGQQYLDHGFLLTTPELPDYVPVFLEFASCLERSDAKAFLAQPAHVFATLEERLAARGSSYAAVFGALVAIGGGRIDHEALSGLRESAPSEDPARIDEEWEEKPVTFTQPSHEMGGPTGMVARVRAMARAAARGERR